MERNDGSPSLRKSSPLDRWILASILDLPVSSGLISGANSILPGRITDTPQPFVHGIPLAVVSPVLISDTDITSAPSPQVHREMVGKGFIFYLHLGA